MFAAIRVLIWIAVKRGVYLIAMNRDIRSTLEAHGIQATSQRLRVAELLFAREQHLTADQVLAALRAANVRISKATVYNTLNLFAERGLLRVLSVNSERCCFDSNASPHHHILVEDTGELIDLPGDAVSFARLPEPPPGTEALGVEVVIRVRRRPRGA